MGFGGSLDSIDFPIDRRYIDLNEYLYGVPDSVDCLKVIESNISRSELIHRVDANRIFIHGNSEFNQYVVTIDNNNHWLKDKIIEVRSSYLMHIRAYIRAGDDIGYFQVGKSEPYDALPIKSRFPSIPLIDYNQEEVTIGFDFRDNFDSEAIRILLWDRGSHEKENNKRHVGFSLLMALLVIYAFVFAIFYFNFKERILILFSIYNLGLLVFVLWISGIGRCFIYPSSSILAVSLGLASANFSRFFLLLVMIEFYPLDSWSKKIRTFIKPLAFLILVLSFAHWFRPIIIEPFTFFNITDIPVMLMPTALLLLSLSIVVSAFVRNRSLQNFIVLLSYLFILLASSMTSLSNQGVYTFNSAFHSVTIGYGIEMLMLGGIVITRLISLLKDKYATDSKLQLLKLEDQKKSEIINIQKLRNNLFANITHEFRTPLTVIMGLSRQIKEESKIKEGIERNSNVLLKLVNQILDFSKSARDGFELNVVNADVIRYIRFAFRDIESWARTRDIRLHFLTSLNSLKMDFDPDAVYKVISNLLSNAIKSIENDGDIYVSVTNINNTFILSVRDTGRGIKEADLKDIFQMYYRSDEGGSLGTGIGLSLSQKLIELHEGNLKVKSIYGEGAEFICSIPISASHRFVSFEELLNLRQVEPLLPLEKHTENSNEVEIVTNIMCAQDYNHSILVVEDNLDLIDYISSCLSNSYNIIRADNGDIAYEQAIEHVPDIIISDVMMPKMNGYELCRKIKETQITSHIPVMLLTAKVDVESRIEGLREGADAYLTKPFNRTELNLSIRNLLDQRDRIQKNFNGLTEVGRSTSKSNERIFLEGVDRIILDNLQNNVFNVVILSSKMHLSRSQLYRKVKALTGLSLSAYVKSIRLKEGKRLLDTTDQSVSEVAYSVGFKAPSYFSTSFSEHFGYPPNATRK